MKDPLTSVEHQVSTPVEGVPMRGFPEVQRNERLLRSDFLSNMTRELRIPLNTILGFAQLMESDSQHLTSSQKASLSQILQTGWSLIEQINEILDLSMVESGRLSLSLEPVSLSEIMSECQTAIEPQAQKRGISMIFPQVENTYFIKADRTRVKQVLINLLSNAIKYNQTGGTVVVTCDFDNPGRTRIKVKDTGVGLSLEKQAQLFQPFNRLGQETSGESGLGIGLAVSKKLAELMQGTIGMESTAGKGSVFWVELISDVNPHLEIKRTGPAVADRAPSRRLLYVEDNPENLNLMENLISRRPDTQILTAKNGNEGIALAGSYIPDVILMDINLPDINGIEAMQIIRRDPATAHIPIIALSANAMQSDIEKGLEEGFFRYLTKPIKFDEFIETLNDAFLWGLHPHHKRHGIEAHESLNATGKYAGNGSEIGV